ncbi:hypothetical protein ACIBO1_26920 [Micromonospora sp. NPDC049903]|uniref:hypothetical protein n=1 Tax=Micromonospora sp. NPDC049903 TaxID=3364276 RepID=UPI0037AE1D23
MCRVTAGRGGAGVGSTGTPSRPAAYAANGSAISSGCPCSIVRTDWAATWRPAAVVKVRAAQSTRPVTTTSTSGHVSSPPGATASTGPGRSGCRATAGSST